MQSSDMSGWNAAATSPNLQSMDSHSIPTRITSLSKITRGWISRSTGSFAVGLNGEYVYDFGDSTYLTFKVLDFVGFAPDDQNGVELVAQNHPPDIRLLCLRRTSR